MVSAYTTVNALGHGAAATLGALREGRSGLRPCDFETAVLDTWIGRVEGLEDAPLEQRFAEFDCRNNRLAKLGLLSDDFAAAVAAARERYGAQRIGVFVSTSTSGVLVAELAYRQLDASGNFVHPFSSRGTQDVFAAADFCRGYLGLEGPAQGISTACSSSAKAFAAAARYIRAGLCEAAVVGGVDSLCLTTLYGFNSLELVSSRPCQPWGLKRDGLNLGEAASFALLERPESCGSNTGIAFSGYGESSDAYHMSSVHPQGAGAQSAMNEAMASAGVAPRQVDYVNLHGTATRANDAAEDHAVVAVFGQAGPPCSSTKGWTGHVLGSSGATEAIICFLCIGNGVIPGSLNTRELDPELSANVPLDNQTTDVTVAMSNSFGFGGTNCSLLFQQWSG